MLSSEFDCFLPDPKLSRPTGSAFANYSHRSEMWVKILSHHFFTGFLLAWIQFPVCSGLVRSRSCFTSYSKSDNYSPTLLVPSRCGYCFKHRLQNDELAFRVTWCWNNTFSLGDKCKRRWSIEIDNIDWWAQADTPNSCENSCSASP